MGKPTDMTANLTTATSSPLLRLLQVFDTESLGEGDMAAGANVLAAKCIALANSYPPGACLVSDDGIRLTVGMSFALIGGLTNSLIADKVITPLACLQNNLVDHIEADAAHAAAVLAAMSPSELCRHRPPPPPPDVSSGLAKLDSEINGFSLVSDSSSFRFLLTPCRNQGPRTIKKAPAVFLDAGTAAGLEKQLSRAHCHFPFVRANLADGPESERMERQLLSVLQGTSISGGTNGPVHIRGHVAVSCTATKLARSVGNGDESLLANLLWLVDGNNDNSLPQQEQHSSTAPYATHLAYPEALELAWTRRLDYRRPGSLTIRYNWTKSQQKWVTVLQTLEPRCPGITRAARPLFATLVAGLLLLSSGQKGAPMKWTDTDALALATVLVMRMVHCREQITQTEQGARVVELAIKIVPKLERCPMSAREIIRKMHKLRIAECRDVLELLNRLGVARTVEDGSWELLLPTDQAVKKIRNPNYFDV